MGKTYVGGNGLWEYRVRIDLVCRAICVWDMYNIGYAPNGADEGSGISQGEHGHGVLVTSGIAGRLAI